MGQTVPIPPGADGAWGSADRRGVVVTEVRVHGVGGASPAKTLNRTDIVPEPGTDQVAGFYGTTQDDNGRCLRAYSWGGLTSRKASRALWILLLPFTFINVAGWMIEPERPGLEERKKGTSRGVLRRFEKGFTNSVHWLLERGLNLKVTSEGLATAQRWLVHVLAVTVTATYVMWAALITVNFVGYQCGAAPECYDNRPWLQYLGFLADEVGLRIVLGSLIPVGLLFLFLWLSRRSRERYDLYGAERAAALGYGSVPPKLTEGAFWSQSRFITNMARIHFGATMALFAGCVSYAMWRFGRSFELGMPDLAGRVGLTAAGVVILASLVAIGFMLRNPSRGKKPGEAGVNLMTRFVFWSSLGLIVFVLLFALSMRASDNSIMVTGNATDLRGFGRLTFSLMAVGVVVLAAATAVQLVRWVWDDMIDFGQFIIPVVFMSVAMWPSGDMLAAVTVIVVLYNLYIGWLRRDKPHVMNLRGHFTMLAGIRALPLLLFFAVLGAGGLFDESWIGVAAAAALIAAAYQITASFERKEMFRWFGTAALGAVGLLGFVGVLAGITLRLEDLLEGGGFDLLVPPVTEWMSLGVFLATVAAWGAGLVFLGDAWLRGKPEWERQADDVAKAERGSVVRWRTLVQFARSFDVLITVYAMLLFSAAAAGVRHVWTSDLPWMEHGVPDSLSGWVEVASWAELAYVGVAYMVVRSALRDEGWRRRLGMVWDVSSFWPNRYHPFAPPAYAARAVPELIERMKPTPSEEDPGVMRATILSGHSQGSVLCFAAVAAAEADVTQHVVLVTHGSPLGAFYRTYFPSVFTEEIFEEAARKLKGSRHCNDGTWVNFYRETDPIAGQVGPMPDAAQSLYPGLNATLAQFQPQLPDALLPDPCNSTPGTRQWRSQVRSHSDYESDPCVANILNAWTAMLRKEADPTLRDQLTLPV